MPLTPNGIFYANTTTPMSLPDITAAMATSVSENISVSQIITATQSTVVSTSSSTTFSAANLAASITPSSRNSKILVAVNLKFSTATNGYGAGGDFILQRNGETISKSIKYFKNVLRLEFFASLPGVMSMNYIDEPNSLSKVTYSVLGKNPAGVVSFLDMNTSQSTITLMEID